MYILRCSDGTYYVGSTRNVYGRLEMHNAGIGASYTRRRRPVELVYAEQFESVAQAYLREKQVQNWSRAKREALIHGDHAALRRGARSTRRAQRDEGLVE